ncbi:MULTISPECIES: TetR/AcrR family transcriptional regulator [unclassified Enterococcus]|uniref:TetR/AcrR family transcriptional regulator n=1 Tax=unclassified Enterococcus TaxID=2608891 RepID=UPI0015532B8E|nr:MULTISPECIES: TetR/AcrR family transcriptional regulator [unclassified Enterococcus]MBS7577379.1 TetR/AcrR family transcriptional regulator [Enterococcus sp. MMGLQ5-2]MBS7584786.1 TetR/AcrR family transcriptional regulator [Enterococcus sp. MMGLQ5-1]NPD12641.1 TetR/AcrR family transcriptional regulator [Enterococcus sp. MMGLQ5-1]NPD37213.1 TetR/AcrR family transcriptional regulator [Enterococcus sp. MMGLQ5-2]
MARGTNPEQTRQKILDVAGELFWEKGYDNTSIQDIIDGLGGLTKGVIYHHFKSKFEILQTVIESSYEPTSLANWRGQNGLEKLQNSLMDAINNFPLQKIGYSAGITLRSPRLLGEQYLDMFQYAVPELKKVIEEGITDGSIETEYPEEVADLIVLTFNTWLGFQISVLTEQQLRRKICFIKQTFDGIGVPLITDELLEVSFKLFTYLKK